MKERKKKKESIIVPLSQFLKKFPKLKLPITLGENSHLEFSKHNELLSPIMIEQFLQPIEEEPIDEFSEFIACFRIDDDYDFHATVYWRASLMNYFYTLVTFDKKGNFIDKRVIGGTFSDGKVLTSSFASINEDSEIIIVSGQANAADASSYNASSSTLYKLEILPDGKIINI